MPIKAWGRFAHEAVVIEPSRTRAYLTEDASGPNGLFYRWTAPTGYRLRPRIAEALGANDGTLEALALLDRRRQRAAGPGLRHLRADRAPVPDHLEDGARPAGRDHLDPQAVRGRRGHPLQEARGRLGKPGASPVGRALRSPDGPRAAPADPRRHPCLGSAPGGGRGRRAHRRARQRDGPRRGDGQPRGHRRHGLRRGVRRTGARRLLLGAAARGGRGRLQGARRGRGAARSGAARASAPRWSRR